jgi:hypothetical protein
MVQTARLTMVYLLVPVLWLLCMPIPGSSRDAKGNYVALGFGLESCQIFLRARSNGLDLSYRSADHGPPRRVLSLSRVRSTYGGVEQRWCLIHLEPRQSQAQRTVIKQLGKQGDAEVRVFKKSCGTTFACEADVSQALAHFKQGLPATVL